MVMLEPIVRENLFDVESIGNAAIPGGGVTVTVILKLNVPLAPGVPLKTFALSCRPGGIVSMDHHSPLVAGGPSEALKVTMKKFEVFPLGSGGEFDMFRIPIVNPAEAVCWVRKSITVTTNG